MPTDEWKKIRQREDYYQGLAKQALDKFWRSTMSEGLAVPPSQIDEAAAGFLVTIDGLLIRAYIKGWQTGIEDARRKLEAKGIKSKYVPTPGEVKPTEDFFKTRQALVDRIEEVKPVLQQASGDIQDIALLKKTLTAVVSVYVNQSYSYSILNCFEQFQKWLGSAV